MNKGFIQAIGPGLLFASTAIGVTHFVLCTTAGALFGWPFLGLIFIALVTKYPFFAFSTRYAAHTGKSLLHAYREVHPMLFYGYLLIQFSSMFTVTAAVSGVCGGLVATMIGGSAVAPSVIAGIILLVSFITLVIGRYKALDLSIKVITVLLLCTAIVTFFISLFQMSGSVQSADYTDMLSSHAILFVVGILGWMPNGLESSIYNSIWIIENNRVDKKQHSVAHIIADFNIGYFLTTLLAFLFVGIGAFTTSFGQFTMDVHPVDFTRALIEIFTARLGSWSFVLIGFMAFAAIYGTLLAAWDVFARTWMYGMRLIRFKEVHHNDVQAVFFRTWYPVTLGAIGLCGFILLYFFGGSISALLHLATLISFLIAPIIAVCNLLVVKKLPSKVIPKGQLYLAYIGVICLLGFTIYYLTRIIH